MTATDARKARRDARELAATRPADPYRGALTDPYSAAPPAGDNPATPGPARSSSEPSGAIDFQPAPHPGNPGEAVAAGVIAIGLGAAAGLFGLLLLAILSLEDEYGAPDRSFYRGSDSSYLVLALVDFALGACLVVGGITLLTGRLAGRVLITVAGWTVLALCAFWWTQASMTAMVPLVMALASATMLMLCYQARVTRWLGVLPAAQPE